MRIDCNASEDGLRTTPCSQCALAALAIDEPLEYARLYLERNVQMWVDAEDSLEL
ncbi:MAG: toxin-antitoxin system protein [Lachnospiraceae bacterium]|nr:toxin-antitoxin system protein [Lachnospiraceae bacterium]